MLSPINQERLAQAVEDTSISATVLYRLVTKLNDATDRLSGEAARLCDDQEDIPFSGHEAKQLLRMNSHLAKMARTQKKAIVELESATGQMSLFGNLPMPDQIRMLEEALTDIEDTTSEQKILRVTRLWREADASGLDILSREMVDDQTFTGQFLQRVLLDGRNPALASGVEKLLKSEKTSLAGIGILHLIGGGSIPALLRQRGYQVEQIY